MPFRSTQNAAEFLFAGRAAADPVGPAILTMAVQYADVVLVAKGTGWEGMLETSPEPVQSRCELVDAGDEFVGRVIGLASGGLRVAAFSSASDGHDFSDAWSSRPLPLAAVVHVEGGSEQRRGRGFRLIALTWV
jgi:hypothetical protein